MGESGIGKVKQPLNLLSGHRLVADDAVEIKKVAEIVWWVMRRI